MNILTTRKLRFYNPNDRSISFVSMGGGNIEMAPDWIATDDNFEAARAAGVLTALDAVTVISAVLPEPEATELPDHELEALTAPEAPAEPTPEAPPADEPKADKKAK